MKQKIEMKVQMICSTCRRKALQVAAKACGVNYVALDGDGKDKVVVIGDGVDAIKLTLTLRKKVGRTDLLSVTEVKST